MHHSPLPPSSARAALLSGLLLAVCAVPSWAQTAEPEPGMWSFDGELNGRPGRSLHIDTQAGRAMAVSYLGYRANGSSFFLQAAGTRPERSSTFEGTLNEFRNGPVIGGGAGHGETAATAGPVKIVFDTPTSGTVTLPGDTPRRISRYQYEDPSGRLMSHSIGAESFAALAEGSTIPLWIDVEKLQDGQFSMRTESFPARLGSPKCTYTGSAQPAGAGVSSEGTYTCTKKDGTQTTGAYRAEHFVMQADGLFRGTLWQGSERVDLFGACMAGSGFMDWPPICEAARARAPQPDPGIWGFEGEVDGRPGRSLQIDTQQGRAMVVTYVGYRPDGSSLFLQASGQRAENETAFTGDLHEYRNGPRLGGGLSNGEEASNLGAMHITFDSATTGTVTLPGDTPRRIRRFQYEDLTARFNQTYRTRYLRGNSVRVGDLRLQLQARDGQFKMRHDSGDGTDGCNYSGSYQLAGRSLVSSGTYLCDGSMETGDYTNFVFEVDTGGHIAAYRLLNLPWAVGICVRSAPGGIRSCSNEELNTPAP
ncbi:hypothetical protein AVMA1855_16175 [Acidovorax sp. SUPP1855]|uniref:hypothetical protein n=1 Tax=Acidovorax sp. SUPP1855 TaxID=431774 RepID=UPI0023DE5145|nr:hypothetical protein [Acidovorax sp. SUPP1855]GKS85709.1 hypothetical protein AVMA1855_16175 [Acidovorax sp. SUPP1855]